MSYIFVPQISINFFEATVDQTPTFLENTTKDKENKSYIKFGRFDIQTGPTLVAVFECVSPLADAWKITSTYN